MKPQQYDFLNKTQGKYNNGLAYPERGKSWGSTLIRKVQSSKEMLRVEEIAILRDKLPNSLSDTKW